ncbi:MAG: DUF3137 domain-containing protein [Rickettsiales bacterium]
MQNINHPYTFVETEPYEKGFAAYYTEHIVPIAKTYEKNRKNIIKKNRVNALLAVTTGIGSSFAMIKSAWIVKTISKTRKGGRLLLIPPLICWWFFVRRPKRKYFSGQKEKVMRPILKFMGDFNYESSGNLPAKIIANHTGYFGTANIFPFEDHISYRKGKVSCKIFERTGIVFLYFELTDNIGIDAVLTSRKEKGVLSRTQTDELYASLKKRLLKRRKLNKKPTYIDPKFDQYFDLYLKYGELDTSWITDKFTDELISLNKAFDKEGMLFSIKDNQVFVELETQHNLFEVGTSYSEHSINAQNIKKLLKELDFTINLTNLINKRLENIQLSYLQNTL